ncbi:germ cell-less protein-like 1 [Corticium candelabrum]|uniref:germ cell-less protein-like 1 n=1 Tax=Corticium candelabrum TaxID=121492 RepID=UPI002E27261B|nr:germ cell-less protein-like 1 [Corticium candelabrum]
MGNKLSVEHRETTKQSSKRLRDEELEDSTEELISSPQRKKMKTTSAYIFDTLFVNGANSDIIIVALGEEWFLHKIYLRQSPYFAGMFSGNWKESAESKVAIDILDPNIDANALRVAFGSMYKDDIELSVTSVISITAAASLFQMDGLLQGCVEFMSENIIAKTVCSFYKAGQMYCLKTVEAKCFEWLEHCLLTSQSVTLLQELSIDLMLALVKSPQLFVMQVEMDLYSLLKQWLYIQLNPDSSCASITKLQAECDQYFSQRAESEAMLETEAGKPYQSVFEAVRLQHVINDIASAQILDTDRIIPESWLSSLYKQQWRKMLSMDQRMDLDPSGMTDQAFDESCVRCGRVLHQDGEYCWRWTGFSFGFDFLIIFSSGLIFVKRNTRTQPCSAAVSLLPKRTVIVRTTAASSDSKGSLIYKKTTGKKEMRLGPDEQSLILSLDPPVRFPLYISVNMAMVRV